MDATQSPKKPLSPVQIAKAVKSARRAILTAKKGVHADRFNQVATSELGKTWLALSRNEKKRKLKGRGASVSNARIKRMLEKAKANVDDSDTPAAGSVEGV